jgi:hypothetical protein
MFQKFILLTFFFSTLILGLYSFTKGEILPADKMIMQELRNEGFVYSVFTPEVTKRKANSPRKWDRVKFNAIAASVLDENGRLPKGSVFPEGSMIVKEGYKKQDGPLHEYAIMKKVSSSENAKEGWLWTELDETGETKYSISLNGRKCLSCHLNASNRDGTRMFDLH